MRYSNPASFSKSSLNKARFLAWTGIRYSKGTSLPFISRAKLR